jgi:hypothetical protein
MAVCGQCHAQADLRPRKSRYPLYKMLGGSKNWSGRVRKISPPHEFDPRPVQSVVTRYTDYTISAKEGESATVWCFVCSLEVAPNGRRYYSMLCEFVVPFVSYDIPTCGCPVSGP